MIKALQSLDPGRKCYRLIGEVLVERTVKEVLPAVKSNEDQIAMVSAYSITQISIRNVYTRLEFHQTTCEPSSL